MGAGNVKAVFARWGDLPHAPFRVLVYMALRSMDDGTPPVFYAGRTELAVALGRQVPTGNDTESKRERRTVYGAVKDATKVLKTRGAVTVIQDAGPGSPARYALNLSPEMGGSETPPLVGAQSPEMGGSQAPPGGAEPPAVVGAEPPAVGGSQPVNGGVSDPTQGVEEERGLTSGVDGWTSHGPSGVAHAREGLGDPLRDLPLGGRPYLVLARRQLSGGASAEEVRALALKLAEEAQAGHGGDVPHDVPAAPAVRRVRPGDCPVHEGQQAASCGGCRADQLAAGA